MSTPFLYPSIIFALGILLGLEIQLDIITLIFVAILPWIFSSVQKLHLSRKRWSAAAVLMLFFTFGCILGNIANQRIEFQSIDKKICGKFEGIIHETTCSEKGMRQLITLNKINNKETQLNICLWTKENQAVEGDVIQWTGTISPISDSLKQENSFFQWLFQKGYTITGFAQNISIVAHSDGFNSNIGKIRRVISHKIEENFYSKETQGLATAILLGDKSGITREMKLDFTIAGAAHILAVSGMHVQLILSLLLFILSRFPNVLRFIIPLIIIILYGFLAGASPAVSRAVIMGVLFLTAQFFKKELPLPNSLAITLFFQLIWDPFAILDLGLQLSYCAIAGIIWLAPILPTPIQNGKSKIYAWINENIKISIAAQLATLPLILIHFGQFPVYFLLTNLLLVPIGNIATIIGFIFIPLSCANFFPEIWGWLASVFFDMLIYFAQEIASLPFSSIRGLQLVYFVMVSVSFCCIIFFVNKTKWWQIKRVNA